MLSLSFRTWRAVVPRLGTPTTPPSSPSAPWAQPPPAALWVRPRILPAHKETSSHQIILPTPLFIPRRLLFFVVSAPLRPTSGWYESVCLKVEFLHTQVITPCHFERRSLPEINSGPSTTHLRMLQVLEILWLEEERSGNGHGPPELKFSAQYSREIMHVRQSNASRVSSFDVIAS